MVKAFGILKKSQQANKLLQLDEFLNKLSGGDIISLLQSFFKSKKGKLIYEKLQQTNYDPKLRSVINNIKSKYNKSPKREKRIWASLVSSSFTLRKLKFDFSISKRQFTNSHKVGSEDPKKIGKKSIQEEITNIIKKFSYENTNEAANRTIQQKVGEEKEIIPVRYPSCCIRCLFFDFKHKHPNIKLSESCFRKYLPKEIKSFGKKRTDLCPYCEHKKDLIKQSQVNLQLNFFKLVFNF